jgi:hypothetical protein
MKAIIQFNFSAGLGDLIVHQFELLNTSDYLKSIGYEIDLKLQLTGNAYFSEDTFFSYLNEDEYKIFNSIDVITSPIITPKHEGLEKIYTQSNTRAGLHCWDLFVDEGPIDEIIKNLSIYRYGCQTLPNKRNIFNKNIIEEYEQLKIDTNLKEPYNSIYMRTEDKNDNMDYFNSHKNKIDEIIKNGDRLFACSNSFNFKNYVRNFENVITIKLPEEENYGAHLYHPCSLFNNMDLVHERTKYTIFEMLLISESKKIDAFCIFGRESNFLFLSAVNKTITNYNI